MALPSNLGDALRFRTLASNPGDGLLVALPSNFGEALLRQINQLQERLAYRRNLINLISIRISSHT